MSIRKKAPAEDIRQERKNLINSQSDFYILEAYKSLRTNVMFSLTGKEGCKVILLTSSMQGEGKSTTAVNLAISFALDGKKVLLVDCDMRRPKLARLMGLRSNIGLSNILLRPELCGSALLPTAEKNMRVLLAGDIPPNPSELLGSPRMNELIDALKKQFDYIILDTPPVNVVTDAMVLCPLTDGVLFVVRSGIAERGSVMRAVDQIERTKTKLLGFILNGVEGKSRSYGHYGKYGGYGYGYAYAENPVSPDVRSGKINRRVDGQ